MSNNNVLITIFAAVIISACCISNVQGAKQSFDTIRDQRIIHYLQYIGLIPEHIKCLKWGYRRTYFDNFKLEVFCLQEPKVHAGDCPIWQDCQWYQFYNYFPTICTHDSDCTSTCKCCFSPCFGTLTCRPTKRTTTSSTKPSTRPTAGTTEANTKLTTNTMTSTTTTITTTTTEDIPSPNYHDDKEPPNELDYDNGSPEVAPPLGPNILEEDSNEYGDSQSNEIPPIVGDEVSKVTTEEPSLIRPPRPSIRPPSATSTTASPPAVEDADGGENEEIDVESGDDEAIDFEGIDRNVFGDDEDGGEDGSGYGVEDDD